MPDPNKRALTAILLLGILALAAGIVVGEYQGGRIFGRAIEQRPNAIASGIPTPAPLQTGVKPYGPDWKRTQVMAAATDPGFPDPRVPPAALPTPRPTPKRTPTPAPGASPSATPNLNLPIWRRNAPLPTASGTPVPGPSLNPSGEPIVSPHP